MNTEFARQQMIKQQVRAWDVLDENVLEVFSDVKRETFVPSEFESLAFADAEIPLAHGQMMLTPTIAGRVLQALSLVGGEDVLEIGTGSGFLTACLATLASHVTSIEIHEDLMATAERNLHNTGIDNVDLLKMNGMKDLPDGKFDAIAVTGSIQQLNTRFVDALHPGGRLFVVVGDAPAMVAQIITKTDDTQWESESIFETVITPLINGAPPPQFLF